MNIGPQHPENPIEVHGEGQASPDKIVPSEQNRRLAKLVATLESSKNEDNSPRVPNCFNGVVGPDAQLLTSSQRFALNRFLFERAMFGKKDTSANPIVLALTNEIRPKVHQSTNPDNVFVLIADNGTVVSSSRDAVLGEGATACVYGGQDVHTGQFYAIKCTVSINKNNLANRENEINALSASGELVDTSEQHMAVIMPYAWGKEYYDCVRKGNLTFIEKLNMFTALVAAVAELHRNGILHRDITIHNAMWDDAKQRCVLIDYGFAVIPGDSLIYQSKILGSFDYIAPEIYQIINSSQITYSAKTDLFALGALGAIFFSKQNPRSVSIAERKSQDTDNNGLPYIYRDMLIFIQTKAAHEVQSLSDLLKQMLDLNPENRPTIDVVINRLKEIHSSLAAQELAGTRSARP